MRTFFTFWRRIPLRAQIFAGFALPVIMVAGLSWVVERNLADVANLSSKADRSIRAVAVRGELLRAVVDAETGERGFIITGNPAFLEPYEHAQVQFARAAREWRQLNGDTPASTLKHVEQLFQRWLGDVAKPAIETRTQAPAGLFSASFEALYHLAYVREQLASANPGTAPLKQLTQFYTHLRQAVNLGSRTDQASEWLQVGLEGEQLRQQLQQLKQASSQEVRTLAVESQQLARHLGDLAYRVRKAEDLADEMVASGRGKELVDQIRSRVSQSILEKEQMHALLGAEARRRLEVVEQLSLVLPVVGVGIGLAFLLLMQLDTIRSIEKLREGAQRIAEGDLDARIRVQRADELGTLGHAFNRMAQQLQVADKETDLLESLQSMLISSSNENEAFAATMRACQKLMPRLQGALYVAAASRDFVEAAVSWGERCVPAPRFHPDDCRALRVGRLHHASPDSAELFCSHTDASQASSTLCVPLVTRDDVLGTLFLATADTNGITKHEQNLAVTIAERLALALSSLRLAEKLRRQSVRDPLTGLFNRRYLEETFDRELARVERAEKPLAVVALDVDHFKRFNDSFGHEAGDLVLKELAAQMSAVVRSADIACRFGGEEFLLVLPEADAQVAQQRAEVLRQRIEKLELQYAGKSLGALTISLGIAVFPQHARKKEDLVRLADTALYAAKKQGRNRVVISEGNAANS